ncbi:MAG: hypothetical protein AB7I45_01350 [Planctomycetota bacterium]
MAPHNPRFDRQPVAPKSGQEPFTKAGKPIGASARAGWLRRGTSSGALGDEPATWRCEMREEPFRSWLMNTYRGERTGAHLSKRPAGDAVSRCKRVEKALRIDLDTALVIDGQGDGLIRRVEASVARFKIEGDEGSGMRSLLSAVRLYVLFREWERGVFGR